MIAFLSWVGGQIICEVPVAVFVDTADGIV